MNLEPLNDGQFYRAVLNLQDQRDGSLFDDGGDDEDGQKCMSLKENVSGPRKRILLVVASPAQHPTLGYPVGFWASELVHAWYEFREVGYEVTLASPEGGRVEPDSYSDPRDASQYSADDILTMGFLSTPSLLRLMETTKKVSDCKQENYDALWVAGGQSPMFTFREDAPLIQLVRSFYEADKVTAVVCHGTCVLLEVKLSSGRLLVEGKHMTGFANSEEDYIESVMKTRVFPFRIEDEAGKRGANFVAAPAFRSHVVRDRNLITGQQHYSGRAAAESVIDALGGTDRSEARIGSSTVRRVYEEANPEGPAIQ